jgi:hypothetical protein
VGRGGMVWYGMVWYGMVWYGMVWYGMVWYGIDSISGRNPTSEMLLVRSDSDPNSASFSGSLQL